MSSKKVPKVPKVSNVSKAYTKSSFAYGAFGAFPTFDTSPRGFTLVELLVAISIIGVLTSLLFASYTTIQQQARNTQRKNDLRQYLTAIENYASVNNGFYPSWRDTYSTPNNFETKLCVSLAQFLSESCPQDPREGSPGQRSYKYYSENAAGGPPSTKAGLAALLDGGGTGAYKWWLVCTNGKSLETTATGAGDSIGRTLIILNCF